MPDPAPTPNRSDVDLEALEAALRRRTRRFARYLKIRAGVGLALLALATTAVAAALAIAGTALGLWRWTPAVPWTHGFAAILAVFLPAAFAFFVGRAGWTWWRHRHLDTPDPGCPSC